MWWLKTEEWNKSVREFHRNKIYCLYFVNVRLPNIDLSWIVHYINLCTTVHLLITLGTAFWFVVETLSPDVQEKQTNRQGTVKRNRQGTVKEPLGGRVHEKVFEWALGSYMVGSSIGNIIKCEIVKVMAVPTSMVCKGWRIKCASTWGRVK